MTGHLPRLLTRAQARRLAALGARADALPPARLAAEAESARCLARAAARLLHRADERLALPLIGHESLARPVGCDWAWRPAPWRLPTEVPGHAAVASGTALGEGTRLFHDCPLAEIAVRQRRNRRAEDVAPFALAVDVYRFAGSFLSLAIEPPPAAAAGLTRRHILRAEAIIEMERPLELFARLNIVHGPNTAQEVRELPPGGGNVMAEIDLAGMAINEKRIERLWLDLILEGPEMNRVTFRDLTLLRRPRNEI